MILAGIYDVINLDRSLIMNGLCLRIIIVSVYDVYQYTKLKGPPCNR